jgi:hypothetical protein
MMIGGTGPAARSRCCSSILGRGTVLQISGVTLWR